MYNLGDIMSNIKLTIREAMEARAMNRYQLCKITGIPYQTLDRYFKDNISRYDSDVLLKVCVALDCGIEEIIEVVR